MIIEINKLNEITGRVIGCAIEVHKEIGPGLLENIYQKALCVEFELNGIAFEAEKEIEVTYKDHQIGNYKADIVVEDLIVLGLKSVERDDSVFEAQLLSYLKHGGYKLGLLINFNKKLLKSGIKRIIL